MTRVEGTERPWIPRSCVWEVTLACDSRCMHCGSAAGHARSDELGTDEGLGLIKELGKLGCESVTLSGGEPLTRPDWPILAGAIAEQGMRLELISNGLRAEAQVDQLVAADFFGITFSVDGPHRIHDRLRGVPGAFERLLKAAVRLRSRNQRVGAVTQVNRLNLHHLSEIHRLLVEHGFSGWQVQLTIPNGRARERSDELCLLPEALPELEAELVRLSRQGPLFVQAADNIGYMSPCEPILRGGGRGSGGFFHGCQAGLSVVGITSHGKIRGCLSMPSSFDEGSLRERSLEQIWRDPKAFAYNRSFRPDALQGACKDCPFGTLCRGGCRSLVWSTAADGNSGNRYCLTALRREPSRRPPMTM